MLGQSELFAPQPEVIMINFTGMGRRDEHWLAADILLYSADPFENSLTELKDISVKNKMATIARGANIHPEFISITFLIQKIQELEAMSIKRVCSGDYVLARRESAVVLLARYSLQQFMDCESMRDSQIVSVRVRSVLDQMKYLITSKWKWSRPLFEGKVK